MVAVRFQDIDNMVVFAWVNFECEWYVVRGGKWEAVPNSNIQHIRVFDAKITVSARGGKFSAYVNGESIVSFFDDGFPTGAVGLRIAGSSLADSFVVRP